MNRANRRARARRGATGTLERPEARVREVRSFPAEIRELRENEDGTLTFEGYASVFNSPSEGLPFRERIMPGAFAGSLAGEPDVRLLYNHDPDSVMARTTAGTLVLEEDDVGLRVTATLDPTDTDVQRLVPKLRKGHVSQMSFAFWTRGDDWVNVDGVLERHVLEADIDDGDVAAVTYPAYPATSAGVRSQAALGAATHLLAYHRREVSGGNSRDEIPLRRALQAIGAELATIAGVEARELNGWTIEDLRPLLYDALDVLLGTGPQDPYYYWFWICAVSDEWFVYIDDRPNADRPGMFQVPFTVDADGTVDLGDPVEVIARTEYLPAPDQGDNATDAGDETGDDDDDDRSRDTPPTMTVEAARLRREAQLSRQGALRR